VPPHLGPFGNGQAENVVELVKVVAPGECGCVSHRVACLLEVRHVLVAAAARVVAAASGAVTVGRVVVADANRAPSMQLDPRALPRLQPSMQKARALRRVEGGERGSRAMSDQPDVAKR